ncbi:phosphatase PAP2 family protein [Kitasatospora indigofera]|uniref:phosphatase PAP2 family protein n=1 Tax=Kitasatospora indigofera TaxID=67307 RepID=UPI003659E4FD
MRRSPTGPAAAAPPARSSARRYGPVLCRLLTAGAAAAVTWYALGRPAEFLRTGAPATGRESPRTGTVLDLLGTGQVLPRSVLLLLALTAATVTGTLVARNLPEPARAGPPRRPAGAPPAPTARPGPDRAAGGASSNAAQALSPRSPPPPARFTPSAARIPSSAAELAPYAVLISAALQGHAVDAVLPLTCLALVLAEFLATGRRRAPGGCLLGIAAAVQPALLLFVLPAWWWRGRRPALTAVALALALGTAARLVRPSLPAAPWHHLSAPEARSALSVLLRLGLHGVPLLCLWAAVALTVAVLALRRCSRFHADGQVLLSLAVVGCASVLLSPAAGPPDLGWLLLAGVGRLGRRPEDRALWPLAAATAVLLPGSVLIPRPNPVNSAVVRAAGVLLAASAAAVLPFRLRDDPLWQARRAPAPAGPAPPGRTLPPLLPPRMRPGSRPNLLLELLLIQICYGIYSFVRNAPPNRSAAAVENAEQLHRLERLLHLDVEGALNGWVLGHTWLLDLMLDYYRVMHFVLPVVVLAWLYRTRPARYRTGRTVLFATTGLALAGYWGLPLAPPRLTPGLGLRETLAPAAVLGPEPGAFTELSNQYAAMPSLHIAWSLWCALAVVTATRNRWVRVLAVLYPSATLLVVLSTANHWLLDAVAAVPLLAVGCLVQYALTGRRLRCPDRDRPALSRPG